MGDREDRRRAGGARWRWRDVARDVVAWLVGLIWIVPFLGILMSALRPQEELLDGWWSLHPLTLSFRNFAAAWNHPSVPLSSGIRNSLTVAIPATVLPVLLGAMAGYGLLRSRSRARSPLFVVVVFLLAVPQQMVAIPLFKLLVQLHLINSFAGLVAVHTAWGLPWIVMFLHNYFATLPAELEEAAQLDGASRMTIFWRLVLPLALPGLAAAAALQFTWVWNDFFFALITIYDPSELLATQRIPLMRGQYLVDWGVLSAASVLVMAVPVLVYTLLQRNYVRGMVGWTLR
ncbi:MAG: carbohydrate ABC transporter permease [Bacillota bacterium]|nr:carbohydrate ABC transporter permease [Bacillota bacterium]